MSKRIILHNEATNEYRCELPGEPGRPVVVTHSLVDMETFLDWLDNHERMEVANVGADTQKRAGAVDLRYQGRAEGNYPRPGEGAD